MRYPCILGVVCLGLFLSAAARADQVENPLFQAWTKFGVGSSETLTGEMNTGQKKVEMEVTIKLIEKTDDHVTVETSCTITMNGQQTTVPIRQRVIDAKADKQDVVDKGQEKVDAAGKTFDCKVVEISVTTISRPPGHQATTEPATDAKISMWVSDAVPGGLVKMDHSSGRADSYLLKSYEVK